MPKNLEQTNDFYELVDMLDFSEVKIGQSQDKTTGAPKTRSDGAPKLYASLPIVSDRDPERNVITLADGKKYRYSHGAIQINLHNLAPVEWAPEATTPGKTAASISLDQLQNLFRRK